MKLLRIRLTHFRGVDQAEVRLAPQGITVIAGPNEIGKSSFADALPLLRKYLDSSRHADVLALQPVGHDVGPEVEVDVETGPYVFTYRKRWVKKPTTELTVHAPRREQLTGRPAHERVEQIFAETLDAQLWSALQQVQGQSLEQPRLADIAVLSRALEGSADGAAADGDHDDLLDAVRAERDRYFTARTGKPTGHLDKLIKTVDQLAAERDHLQQRLVEADDLTLQHVALGDRMGQTRRTLDSLTASAVALEAQRAQVERLALGARAADAELESARLTGAAAAKALDERVALREAHDLAVENLHASRATLTAAAEQVASVLPDADGVDEADGTALETAASHAAEQVRLARLLLERDEVEALLARLGELIAEVEASVAALAAHRVDDAALRAITAAHRRVEQLTAEQTAVAGSISVERLGDHDVTVDGAPVRNHEASLARPTVIEAPGVVRISIAPAGDAADLSARLDSATATVRELLDAAGVADVEAAEAAAAARRDAHTAHQMATTALVTFLGGRDSSTLEARRAELHEALAGHDTPVPPLDEAQRAEQEARAAVQTHRDAVDAARAAARRREEALAAHRESKAVAEAAVARLEAEAARLDATLGAARDTLGDDALDAAAEAAYERLAHADAAARGARQALADSGATEAMERLASVHREITALETEHLSLERERSTLEGRLQQIARYGLQDQFSELDAELADTQRQLDAELARAGAARLLYDVMLKHKEAAQDTYVAPFTHAVENLGRRVFGESFAVHIDASLAIESRTLHGATVPFGALSGGAREQLSIIGRLATAQLVGDDDGAPVVLDDALGFSDPDRLAAVAGVLQSIGERSQVIVLTCYPERFASLEPAARVTLGPA